MTRNQCDAVRAKSPVVCSAEVNAAGNDRAVPSSDNKHIHTHCKPTVVLRPDPSERPWGEMALARFNESGAAGQRLRTALGLPANGPVVMTGHQAEFWHPGIVAKLIAAEALAERFGTDWAWVIVDQDDNDPRTLRFPVATTTGTAGETTTLRVHQWKLASGNANTSKTVDDRENGVPIGRRGPITAPPLPNLEAGERYGGPGVEPGLRAVLRSLALAGSNSKSLSMQVTIASMEMLKEALGSGSPGARTPRLFGALMLSDTAAFRSLVMKMTEDPIACVAAYNTAAARFPAAGVKPLTIGKDTRDGGTELPLWRLGAGTGTVRRKANVADAREWLAMPDLPVSAGDARGWALAPRALLMTGLLRQLACDLFIHGLGGEIYDPITEAWFGSWLGVTLAPTVVVSATVRLRFDLGDRPAVTLEDVARAQWSRQHARHDPSLLGDGPGAARKLEIVGQLRVLKREKRHSPAARAESLRLYREMHGLLESVRQRHADELSTLDRVSAELHIRSAEAEIVSDRTWAFPLYQASQLAELREIIRDRAR